MQSRSIPSCGLRRKRGRLQVFDSLCVVSENLRWFRLSGVVKKTDCGSHSSTEAEIVPMTNWRMRFPFWHFLLVFKGAVVGTAHSGIGVFVMTEAERKRHDARILAYGRRLLQGQAKVRTHDEADANFAS